MATLEERQKVHQSVLRHFVMTGRAPHYTELAEALDIVPGKARQILRETTTESPFLFAWITPDTDYIGSWAPFSNLPNQHLISVDGVQKWYGQGGLEALAVSHLFPGKDITINTRCLQSGDQIRVRMRGSQVLEVSPDEAIGYSSAALEQWGEPSWAYTGARMNLFRSEESVRAWDDFKVDAEKTIKPVREWADMFQGAPLFRQRLDDDFVEKSEAYGNEALSALGEALG